ncbi:MAG: hypothetical protein JNL40_00290 [Cyclobacteriaceae bacterium]|nr:hypothetical protein [Cyclobacteriaceae bacterium]
MNKENLFLYSFALIVVIKVGLFFPTRETSRQVIGMTEEYKDILNEINKVKTFDDSLFSENPDFRQRLLDTISTVAEFQQLQENQRNELTKRIKEYGIQYPDPKKVIRTFEILDALNILLSAIIACMALLIIINAFRRR